MKKAIIILTFFITVFLVSCIPVTCNKPYLKVGTTCCLDQNDNSICDSDETAGKEQAQGDAHQNGEALIAKDVSELALYSNEIEAGYSLQRRLSGVYTLDLEGVLELKALSLEKAFVTSYVKESTTSSEERLLNIYSLRFDTIDGATDAFGLIETMIERDDWYVQKTWTGQNFGDDSAIFLRELNYNFIPYVLYKGLIRIKNVIVEVELFAPVSQTVGPELTNYLKKLEAKVLSLDSSTAEVDVTSSSSMGAHKEGLLEIKHVRAIKKTSIPKAELYRFTRVENLIGTDKQYLIGNFLLTDKGVNNIYTVDGQQKKGFDTQYSNFMVIDEKGNYNTAAFHSYVLPESKAGEILPQDAGFATAYAFPIFKDSETFVLRIYDDDLLIYEEDFFSFAEEEIPTACITPYVRLGARCCKDTNDNGTCDIDETPKNGSEPKNIVSAVQDGNVFVLNSGQRVRLLGINAPDKGEAYFMEATQRLAKLISGKDVTLEKDVIEVDDSNHLLRYVFNGEIFVNEVMVKEGFAKAVEFPPNAKYSQRLKDAEESAKLNKLGIWW